MERKSILKMAKEFAGKVQRISSVLYILIVADFYSNRQLPVTMSSAK